jgi:hypothetical protein
MGSFEMRRRQGKTNDEAGVRLSWRCESPAGALVPGAVSGDLSKNTWWVFGESEMISLAGEAPERKSGWSKSGEIEPLYPT